LQADANRLSNALLALGVKRGDRVAIVLPQRAETAVAHLAIYQLGAVAMPLSMLFGPERSSTACRTAARWSRCATPRRWISSPACGRTARRCSI